MLVICNKTGYDEHDIVILGSLAASNLREDPGGDCTFDVPKADRTRQELAPRVGRTQMCSRSFCVIYEQQVLKLDEGKHNSLKHGEVWSK